MPRQPLHKDISSARESAAASTAEPACTLRSRHFYARYFFASAGSGLPPTGGRIHIPRLVAHLALWFSSETPETGGMDADSSTVTDYRKLLLKDDRQTRKELKLRTLRTACNRFHRSSKRVASWDSLARLALRSFRFVGIITINVKGITSPTRMAPISHPAPAPHNHAPVALRNPSAARLACIAVALL